MMVSTLFVSFSFFGIDETKLFQDSDIAKGSSAVSTLGTAISGGNITIECDKCETATRIYAVGRTQEYDLTILDTDTDKAIVSVPPMPAGFYNTYVITPTKTNAGIVTSLEVFDCNVCRIYDGCFY